MLFIYFIINSTRAQTTTLILDAETSYLLFSSLCVCRMSRGWMVAGGTYGEG